MLVITDPVTGVRVLWRGGTTIRAYDRRARLISKVALPEPQDAPPAAAMRELARSLGVRRARLRRG